jgi:hypothetical protein
MSVLRATDSSQRKGQTGAENVLRADDQAKAASSILHPLRGDFFPLWMRNLAYYQGNIRRRCRRR